MRRLWTKNGLPLLNSGNDIFDVAGTLLGRIRGDRVFRIESGNYVGTLVGDRLVYRSFDINGPNRPYTRPVSAGNVDSVPVARMWGDEPTFQD